MARKFPPGSIAGLILAASAASGCLLYTDPINTPPAVTIEAPTPLHLGQATFRAIARDDQEGLTFVWHRARGTCSAGQSWTPLGQEDVASVTVGREDRQGLAVRVTVTDRYGAATESCVEGKPANRVPEAVIAMSTTFATAEAPLKEARFPLHALVRLSAAGSRDGDNDPLTYEWSVLRGADSVATVPCPENAQASVVCLRPDQPGSYVATLRVRDGIEESAPASFAFSVDEDAAPCLEQTDPELTTRTVVVPLTSARRFEVRRVLDDGHPFPAGPKGVSRFVWSTARATGPWQRRVGHDGAALEISAALFDDVRPGDRVRVRVEPRDPAHEDARALAALDAACGDSALCELPPGCARWASWTLEFR